MSNRRILFAVFVGAFLAGVAGCDETTSQAERENIARAIMLEEEIRPVHYDPENPDETTGYGEGRGGRY